MLRPIVDGNPADGGTFPVIPGGSTTCTTTEVGTLDLRSDLSGALTGSDFLEVEGSGQCHDNNPNPQLFTNITFNGTTIDVYHGTGACP